MTDRQTATVATPASAPVRRSLHDLPIPLDVQPGKYWTEVMLELSAHIGPYATLVLVDALGGTDPYIPVCTVDSKYAPIIGEEKAAILHKVYGLERLQLPVAGDALRHARRAGVLAAIRAGDLTLTEAAKIRDMGSRAYISYLLNHTGEGTEAKALAVQPGRLGSRQLALFNDEEAA
jgi:hypothetical protein